MPSHPVRPPEWIDSAPSLVEQSIDIKASNNEVWVHIADHERWPEWFETLESVKVTGGGPNPGTGIGAQRTVTVRGSALDEEFTAWKPGEQFAFAVTASKVPVLAALAEEVRLLAVDGGCRVSYRQGIEMRKGFGWLGRPVASQMSKQLGVALANLKLRCES